MSQGEAGERTVELAGPRLGFPDSSDVNTPFCVLRTRFAAVPCLVSAGLRRVRALHGLSQDERPRSGAGG